MRTTDCGNTAHARTVPGSTSPCFAHLGVPRVPPGRYAMDFTAVALTALQVVSPVLVAALTWAAAKLARFIRSKVDNEYLHAVMRHNDPSAVGRAGPLAGACSPLACWRLA